MNLNIPEVSPNDRVMQLAHQSREDNLNKIFNFCFKTLGPSTTVEKLETCFELFNATNALGEKSFSLYLKNKKFRNSSPPSQ